MRRPRFVKGPPPYDKLGDPVLPPNAWWCVCRTYNHSLRDVCTGCGVDVSARP